MCFTNLPSVINPSLEYKDLALTLITKVYK